MAISCERALLGISDSPKKDRDMNIERVTFVAKLLTRNEVAVLATFVSPYGKIREYSRKEIGEYLLVYVKCPVESKELKKNNILYLI